MLRRLLFACLLFSAAPALADERVEIPALDKRDPAITGVLLRPRSDAPAPAVVMLHGCDGMYRARSSSILNGRSRDWGDRLVSLGFVVLITDSFEARGVTSACDSKEARARPRQERSRDVLASLAYLRSLPFVRADSLAIAGWSHGGTTALAAIGEDHGLEGVKTAVSFYPNCKNFDGRKDWQPHVPLALYFGDADEWTTTDDCLALAEKYHFGLVAYPGAVHGFDTPNLSPQVLTGVSTPSGTAQLGTDPVARADAIKRVSERLVQALKP